MTTTTTTKNSTTNNVAVASENRRAAYSSTRTMRQIRGERLMRSRDQVMDRVADRLHTALGFSVDEAQAISAAGEAERIAMLFAAAMPTPAARAAFWERLASRAVDHAERSGAGEQQTPLVVTGQGDFRREYHAGC